MAAMVKQGVGNKMSRTGKLEAQSVKPYPPNFSSTPARIIEPAVGASTWPQVAKYERARLGL